MSNLTGLQVAFVEAYLGEANFNATQAARLAGYTGNDVTLASVGYENLRKPQIAELVKTRLAETAMTADEVLMRLGGLARSDGSGQLKALEMLARHHGLFEADHKSEVDINLTDIEDWKRKQADRQARASETLDLFSDAKDEKG